MSVRIIDKAAEKVVGVRVVGPYPQTIPQGSQQLLAWRQRHGVPFGKWLVLYWDDPAEVARQMKKAMPLVKENRRNTGDAYSFNWSIRIAPDLQLPFEPTHENMANLNLYPNQPPEQLAAALRRAFSGIVAGNVKENGIHAIEQFGPYKLHGEPQMMKQMDSLLQGFVAQHRMKLPGSAYVPCYEIVA